jgi:hypothetical protein
MYRLMLKEVEQLRDEVARLQAALDEAMEDEETTYGD